MKVMTMAELCPDCWNKMNGTKESPGKYMFSKDLELCEGCGKWKNVIVKVRKGAENRGLHSRYPKGKGSKF